MKRTALFLFAALTLLLSGCASTIRSTVTAFNEWPADLQDKSYVFERTKEKDQSLAYRAYEDMVRNEVRRLGLTEAAPGKKPALKITLDFNLDVVDVRVVQPIYADPFFYGSGFFGHGFYGRRYYGAGLDPFYWDPPMMGYRDRAFQVNRRRLHVLIGRYADGRSLYDVTVDSQGESRSLPAVMPYLVRSAFADFPGRSGVTRVIDLTMEN